VEVNAIIIIVIIIIIIIKDPTTCHADTLLGWRVRGRRSTKFDDWRHFIKCAIDITSLDAFVIDAPFLLIFSSRTNFHIEIF
jgi:hypothetical protein